MPQAVDAYVSGKSYEQIDFVKRNILSLYEEDLAKYDTENREKASVIYRTIPEQLENKNSHFKLSMVDKNARYQNYMDAVSFISEAMIGNECINVTNRRLHWSCLRTEAISNYIWVIPDYWLHRL